MVDLRYTMGLFCSISASSFVFVRCVVCVVCSVLKELSSVHSAIHLFSWYAYWYVPGGVVFGGICLKVGCRLQMWLGSGFVVCCCFSFISSGSRYWSGVSVIGGMCFIFLLFIVDLYP